MTNAKKILTVLAGIVAVVMVLTAISWAAQPQGAQPLYRGSMLQILAEKLGKSPAELQQILAEARAEALGQVGPPAQRMNHGRGITLRARDGTGPRCRR
jgi:hypothetical protein